MCACSCVVYVWMYVGVAGCRMHWSDSGWETWWPEYDKPLGKPLGGFKREGKYKFSREFEHLTVSLDCDVGFATTFDWH